MNLLPPKGDGMRWSNSDPVTGQAAWFDLRVRIEKADGPPGDLAHPQFEPTWYRTGDVPEELRYGQEWGKTE
jgi:hypothetical protein